MASGAVQRIGIFPPCDDMQERLPGNANTTVDLKQTRLGKCNLNSPPAMTLGGNNPEMFTSTTAQCDTCTNDLPVYKHSCSHSKVLRFVTQRWKPRTDLNWDTSTACGPTHNYTNEYHFRNTFMIPSFTFFYKFPVLTVGGPEILLLVSLIFIIALSLQR